MEGVFAKVKGQGAVYGLDTDRWDEAIAGGGESLYVETMDQWADGHLYEFKSQVREGAFHIQIRKIPKTHNLSGTNSQYQIETARIEAQMLSEWMKVIEVKLLLVQVEWSRRDLHEVQCMTFFQQTKIQSDLRDEESPQGRKWNLNRTNIF